MAVIASGMALATTASVRCTQDAQRAEAWRLVNVLMVEATMRRCNARLVPRSIVVVCRDVFDEMREGGGEGV